MPDKLRRYLELFADVRYNDRYNPIRALVMPDDPEIKEVAQILHRAPDFIAACQEFVHSFTTYKHEPGDYWATAVETLHFKKGDCDCLGILLCSLLRNYIPAEKVFCAIGTWDLNGSPEGHLWVVTEGEDGQDRDIESTSGPDRPVRGEYKLYAMFNDWYTFASPEGLAVFDLRTPELVF